MEILQLKFIIKKEKVEDETVESSRATRQASKLKRKATRQLLKVKDF